MKASQASCSFIMVLWVLRLPRTRVLAGNFLKSRLLVLAKIRCRTLDDLPKILDISLMLTCFRRRMMYAAFSLGMKGTRLFILHVLDKIRVDHRKVRSSILRSELIWFASWVVDFPLRIHPGRTWRFFSPRMKRKTTLLVHK